MPYLAICLGFLGCSTPRVIQDCQRDSECIIVKDSLVLKDTIVLVEIPTERERLVVAATDTSYLETSVAKSIAFINDNGRLHHTLTNKDALLPVKVSLPMKVHTEQREKAMIIRQTVEVEKELSRWQNFLITVGYTVLVALAVWLIMKIRRLLA